MGFWVFMLAMALLIPLTMIGFGRYFAGGGPGNVSNVFGYRTRRSMRNRDTWQFAHKYCGRLWFWWGLILLPPSAAVMLLVLGKGEDAVGTAGGILCLVQSLPLVIAIPLTERALTRTFDPAGRRY